MTKTELKIKLEEANINEFYNKVEPFLKNSIRLNLSTVSEDQIKIGSSKIGGKPDLPKNQKWFTETNSEIIKEKKFLFFNTKIEKEITRPLSFIAQINLSEVSHLNKEQLLPNNGFLYFFYTAEQNAWGFDIKDKNKFKVFYYEGDSSELVRTEYPDNLSEYGKFKNCALSFEEDISMPTMDNQIYNSLDEKEIDYIFGEIMETELVTKLLGYSDIIQNEMELECELVTNGIYCGNPSGFENPKAKELEPNAKDWQLLFQIDSDDNAQMMWGDCGRLYFWIKTEDLKNKRFENCWTILQCF